MTLRYYVYVLEVTFCNLIGLQKSYSIAIKLANRPSRFVGRFHHQTTPSLSLPPPSFLLHPSLPIFVPLLPTL